MNKSIHLADLKKLPRSTVTFLAMVLALVALVGLISWQVIRVMEQQNQLEELQAERDRLESIALENRQLEAKLKVLNGQWETARARLPDREDYAGLVQLIGSKSELFGVQIGPLNPTTTSGKGAFPYLSSPLEMNGSFPKILALMNDLQRSGRTIILKDVIFALGDGGGVSAKMVLEAYYNAETGGRDTPPVAKP